VRGQWELKPVGLARRHNEDPFPQLRYAVISRVYDFPFGNISELFQLGQQHFKYSALISYLVFRGQESFDLLNQNSFWLENSCESSHLKKEQTAFVSKGFLFPNLGESLTRRPTAKQIKLPRPQFQLGH